MLTQHELKQILRYDPDTGLFYRLTDKRSGKPSGKQTGTIGAGGYVRLRADKLRTAHRLAFLYMTGSFPEHVVDHINGVKSDNRWCNLRLATRSENQQNQRGAHTGSKSGLLGVSWRKSARKWQAEIQIAGVDRHLGLFDCPYEAAAAYLKAKRELHPFSTL